MKSWCEKNRLIRKQLVRASLAYILKRIVPSLPIIYCFFFGISSGLPLVAAGGTLQAWMKNGGIDLKTIGFFSLVGLPYSYKFLWSPLVDRFELWSVGRRKSWMYATQSLLIVLLLLLSFMDPTHHLGLVSVIALAIAFCSATQDIVLDAYRRDILTDDQIGLGASVFVTGYRVGLLIGGALSLWLTQFLSWQSIYIFLSVFIYLGVVATFLSKEPEVSTAIPRTLLHSVIEPLKHFFNRRHALPLLIFILLYKIGDTFAASMSSLFILDLGFTNAELGAVGKTYGLIAAILGGLTGGALIPRCKLYRSLVIFGVIQGLGILAFALLANIGKDHFFLVVSVIVENFTSGLGTAAFLAFLGILCDRRFSATQYALLSSISSLPRTMFSFGMGALAQQIGWTQYFLFCTSMAAPGLLLLLGGARWFKETLEA